MSDYSNWIDYVVATYDNRNSYTELELLQRYLHIISYEMYGAPSWSPWNGAEERIVIIENMLSYTWCMNNWDFVYARIAEVEERIDNLTPDCQEDEQEIIELCPDGITTKSWRECVNGEWIELSQDCPVPPTCEEGAVEIIEYCPDGTTPKRWTRCTNDEWIEYEQDCEVPPPPPSPSLIKPIAAISLISGASYLAYKLFGR